MEKRTAKAGIHEKDRSTTSSSVHTVMSSSAPSTTHLSILRGSEKKCTPILTIAPFFTITLVFFYFKGKQVQSQPVFFSTENSAFTNIPANGPPDWQKLHGIWLSYSPYPLHFEKTELPVSRIFVETKEGGKGYRPDPEGLFKGIEPLFPRRPSSLP